MPNATEIEFIVTTMEQVAAQNGISDAFWVGGFPRSLAMGLPLSDVHDLDVATATPGKATQLAGLFSTAAHADSSRIRHRTNTVTVALGEVEIDFQGSTDYEKTRPFLHAWSIEATPLALNIYSRDFTINSLAIPIGGDEIIDLTRRGMPDIHDKRIASILPPDDAIPDNPLIITRAVRLAAKYNFRIEANLWRAMKEHIQALEEKISPERLALEALAMSPYNVKPMLKELGLSILAEEEFIEAGQEIDEEKRSSNDS
jgi:tRNA nucleotidyltransferase/poly(A) polymerase